jgi:hypothetical protein
MSEDVVSKHKKNLRKNYWLHSIFFLKWLQKWLALAFLDLSSIKGHKTESLGQFLLDFLQIEKVIEAIESSH